MFSYFEGTVEKLVTTLLWWFIWPCTTLHHKYIRYWIIEYYIIQFLPGGMIENTHPPPPAPVSLLVKPCWPVIRHTSSMDAWLTPNSRKWCWLISTSSFTTHNNQQRTLKSGAVILYHFINTQHCRENKFYIFYY